MPVDALTLVSRIVDRAAEKWGQSIAPSSSLALDEGQRTELLVETLATQLLGYFGGSAAQPSAGSTTEELERVCADQIARNRELAGALGACDCWGELPSCDRCGGRGAPGWRRPHVPAFDRLVRPVLRRMQQQRAATHGRPGADSSRPTQSPNA